MIRWPWRAATLAGAALIGWRTTEQPSDLSLFARAGQSILAGRWGDVYGEPANQAGPLQQLLARGLTLGADPARPAQLVMVAVDVLIMLVAIESCRLRPGRGRVELREVLVAGCTAGCLANPAFWGGHPIELLIPTCWLAAALTGSRHPVRAALTLVAAATVAPWGVLGFPLVLDRRRPRPGLLAMAAATGATVAAYAPLLLAGRGGSLHFRWGVSRDSLVHLVDPGLQTAGWSLRVLQGVAVVLICAALRWRMPSTPLVASVLVTAIALLRVATDPLTMYYYWMPAAVGMVAVVILAPDLRRRNGVVAFLAAYVVLAGNALDLGVAGAAGALCLLGVVVHSQRRTTTPPVALTSVGSGARDPEPSELAPTLTGWR